MLRHFAPEKDYELSPALWRLLLLLTVTPLGVTCSLVLLTSPSYELSASTMYAFVACLFIAFISFIGLLWSVTVLARQRKLEADSLMSEMNRRYYASMEEQQFEVRRLRHDLANHLQVLASLPDAEKGAYLDELIRSPAMRSILHYCKDSTVNAVLGAKVPAMAERSIQFRVKADIAEELPFNKADICALLANAIDNAAEACLKLPEDCRRVTMNLRSGKGMFAASIVNPIADELSPDASDALPRTSKADKGKHGYGLRSIREIVGRCGGSMEIQVENGEFTLFLYMPLDAE